MLVPAVADQADLGQPRPDLAAGLAVLLRQPQAERSVGHAQFEVRDQFRVRQAARGQVGLRRAFLTSGGQQALVVVADGLVQQRLIVGIEGHRRRQGSNGGTLHGAFSS